MIMKLADLLALALLAVSGATATNLLSYSNDGCGGAIMACGDISPMSCCRIPGASMVNIRLSNQPWKWVPLLRAACGHC